MSRAPLLPASDPTDDWQPATILAVLPRGLYRVRLDDGREATVHRAGALRLSRAPLRPAAPVWVVLAARDPSRGRVVARR